MLREPRTSPHIIITGMTVTSSTTEARYLSGLLPIRPCLCRQLLEAVLFARSTFSAPQILGEGCDCLAYCTQILVVLLEQSLKLGELCVCFLRLARQLLLGAVLSDCLICSFCVPGLVVTEKCDAKLLMSTTFLFSQTDFEHSST